MFHGSGVKPACLWLLSGIVVWCAGKLQSLMDEKKALEMRAENLSGELQKGKTQFTDSEAGIQRQQVFTTTASSLCLYRKRSNGKVAIFEW